MSRSLQEDGAVEEVLQRVRRIETRVYKLCEVVGVEAAPGTNQIEVEDIDGQLFVRVQGFDTPLSRIKRALQDAEVPYGARTIRIMLRGMQVATVILT
jgi:hypothetical protein